MRKNFLFRFLPMLALISSVVFVSSCKRGEDDPFLSLRSRDNRVMGEWTVSSVEAREEINESSNSLVTNIVVEQKFSGDNYTTDSSITTNTTNYKRTYTQKAYSNTLNIMEGGILEAMEKYSDETITGTNITGALTNIQSIKTSIKGYWKWGSDEKNKGTIVLSVGPNGMFFGALGTATYQIQKLTNKEMVLIYNDYDKREAAYPGLATTYERKASLKVVLKQGE
jgi:hypothetical protein